MPEPMTAGSSPRTSEISRASTSSPVRAVSRRPPLIRDRRLRTALIWWMSRPEASSQRLTRCRVSRSTPATGASTRLEVPPEIRNSTRSPRGMAWTKSSSASPALRLAASGTGCPASRQRTRGSPSRDGTRCPYLVMTRAAWSRSPRASRAPAVMAAAALPTATARTGPGRGARRSRRATTSRPLTARRASPRMASSSRRPSPGAFTTGRPAPAPGRPGCRRGSPGPRPAGPCPRRFRRRPAPRG